VTVSLSFGGKNWTISPADFRLARLSSGNCLGAFFEFSIGSSAPPWIIGDTFLVTFVVASTGNADDDLLQKNVFSVFRFNPPSVGFAQLSDIALAQNGATGSAPSPTIGAVQATIDATSRSNGRPQSLLSLVGATVVAPVFVFSALSLFSIFLT